MSVVTENPDHMDIDAIDGANVYPLHFLSPHERTSLVILNQKIENIDLETLWYNTSLHVCADGGANKLFEFWEKTGRQNEFVPHFIVGDLDSLDDETRGFYESHGTKIIPQYTQYASDFMKAISVVVLYFADKQVLEGNIDDHDGVSKLVEQVDLAQQLRIDNYILNGLGGRFDQTIQSINQLLILKQQQQHLTDYFITQDDIVFLVPKGLNFIQYESKEVFGRANPVCGLLPIGGPVKLTTRGLKWDVKDWDTQMGGSVSSSNALVGNKGFVVDTTGDIIVNIEYRGCEN